MANPIKLGIVGLGRAGKGMHCAELEGKEDKIEIAAVCDIIKSRCDEMATKYGCKTYDNIEDIINDPDIEIIDIATRSVDHFKHACMALEAGKSVFLEKPMCLTYQEALLLKALSSQPYGPRLYIRHNRRFEGKFTQISEIIDSGILGEVYEIKLTRNSYDRRSDWQTLREFGGGQLLNWGPHIIDHALCFCEGQYDVLYSDIKHVAAGGDCEDHIKIVFTGKNGRIVDIEISGGVSLDTPQYLVYGSKGTLMSTAENLKLRYLDPKERLPKVESDPSTPGETHFPTKPPLPWIEEEIPARSDGKLDQLWDALYASIREGIAYPITITQAISVIEVIDKVKKETIFR